MQWMPLIAPKGWRYHLEKVPQVFLDDPHAQWNLIAHLQEGEAESTPRAQKSLTLATLSLGENGLDIEWKSQTAGLDSNLEIVNKLPFSYLRMSFGPNAATEGGPGKERKTLPIPKRFDAKNDVATIDFLESTWFKDVALWSPSTNKPFVFSEKGEINRPANPTEKFENVFGKDRFRVGLEQIDLADALSLEVFVTPDLGKNMTAIVEETDSPRKKTVSVTVDSVGEKKTTVVIPIAVEVFPDRIEFRDVSQDLQSEAIKSRTALTKTIKEKNEALAGAKLETFQTSNTGEKVGEKEAQNAFDLYKRSLQREIDEAKRKQTQANEQFVAIPLARKQLFGVEMRIRYSVYLQGGDSTEKMLILTTSGGEPPR